MLETNSNIDTKLVLEARAMLWNMGSLEWKLDITQKKLYDFYMNKKKPNGDFEKTIVVNCSRRLGKSYFLVVLAIEKCLQKPRAVVKFLQPKVNMIRINIRPILNEILMDCPRELRPEFKTQDNIYRFPNGSEIHLAGTDNGNYDKLRGGNCDLALVDEAGFCSDLEEIIKSILIPTTTLTRGRIILSSTTPPDPDHEFIQYMEAAEKSDTLIRKTILDAVEDNKKAIQPRITEEIVSEIIASYPTGVEDQRFRTEYLCEKIFDSKDSVLPEFDKEAQLEIIHTWPKPVFYDRYTAMDIGFKDLTVVLFAYWDFDNNILVIEDEIVLQGAKLTTPTLAKEIKKKEDELWKNHLTGEVPDIYKRVSDNNLIVINDLAVEHGLGFIATQKHDKLAYMSALRDMITLRQIVINPRCNTLISHMKTASWDKAKKDFKRNTIDGHHYDAVAALLYLSRNIDKTRNPYPQGYQYSKLGKASEVFVKDRKIDVSTEYEKLSAMFKPKSSFRRGK